MNKVQEFCKKAREAGVDYGSMVGCINKIQAGRPMSEDEKRACDFLGEPETFWNPVKHMDYNWFLDNADEIWEEMG